MHRQHSRTINCSIPMEWDTIRVGPLYCSCCSYGRNQGVMIAATGEEAGHFWGLRGLTDLHSLKNTHTHTHTSELSWRGSRCNFITTQIKRRIQTGCKIWGFHSDDYEECLLGYKNPVRTSQQTHYVSAIESSRLILCRILGFHNDDYEECRILGYKNPVRTSQETLLR
jgi:hypothetical protein